MAKKRRLVWQIYPYVLGVVLLCLAATTIYVSAAMRQFNLGQVAAHLERTANLFETQVVRQLGNADLAGIQSLCKNAGSASGIRVTVTLTSGEVVGDSLNNPADMENHANRPEIQKAMGDGKGTSTRFSTTLGQRMMYVAVRLTRGSEIIGTIRTSVSVSRIDQELREIQWRIIFGAFLIAILIIPVTLLVSRIISRPVEALKHGADRFSAGDLSHRLPQSRSIEIAALAESMNQMASKLERRIQTIVQQRNDLEALLSSMTEGVLAIDRNEKVIFNNRALSRFLGLKPSDLVGRNLQEIIRNPGFEKFVQLALASPNPIEGEVTLFLDRERFMRIHGTPLMAATEMHVGTLLVLDDVTRLKRLESMRRDFAASVSHEIRTPITAIKGFVETLLDNGDLGKADSERFLRIIHRHVDRLIALIEDLISLSRIEKQVEAEGIDRTEELVLPVIEAAVGACTEKAREKAIRLDVACEAALTAPIHPALLERALFNFIDNAINYSESGGSVRVVASRSPADLVIGVEDEGIGIPRKHLPRLFERFYRVDKARSRNSGGTGLGLAIVKHIALAHGGQVNVTSTPGKGSRFEIRIPTTLRV